MAASDHIGQQFVRLYRGLHSTSPEHLEKHPTGIGPHWSKSPEVAYNFATYRDFSGTPHWNAEDDAIPMAGTVVEALVHKRHIIDPDSDEGQDWQHGEAVFGPEHSEQERTVRPGSPVHVQRMHYFDDDNDKYRSATPMRRKGYRA